MKNPDLIPLLQSSPCKPDESSSGMSRAISQDELEFQLAVAKADVAELQALGQTSAAAAYFTIQSTLERFLGKPTT